MAAKMHDAIIHHSVRAMSASSTASERFSPMADPVVMDLGVFGWELTVVLRPDNCPKRFTVIPKRWIVERCLSWLENFRRLAIYYESYFDSTEAMIQIDFTQIMLKKLSQ